MHSLDAENCHSDSPPETRSEDFWSPEDLLRAGEATCVLSGPQNNSGVGS